MNSYNKCAANKIINGKKSTIQCYLDDNKVTHFSEYVITGEINSMKKQFGELVVSCGGKYTFLGMDI